MPIYPALDVRVPQFGKAMQLREQVQRGRAQDERATAAQALNAKRLDAEKQRWDEGAPLREATVNKALGDLKVQDQNAALQESREVAAAAGDPAREAAYNAANLDDPIPALNDPNRQNFLAAADITIKSQPPDYGTSWTNAQGQRMIFDKATGQAREIGTGERKKYDAVTFISPPGSKLPDKTLNANKDQDKIDALTAAGWTEYKKGVSAATKGGLTERDESKLNRELEEKRDTVYQLMSTGSRLMRKADEGGASVMSLVGSATRSLNTLYEQAKAASKVFGVPDWTADELELKESEGFSKAAANSAAFKSNMISLAFSQIHALQPTGVPTKQDMQQALDTIGAGSGSPQQMAAAINDVMAQAMASYKITHWNRTQAARGTGERYDFTPEEFEGRGVPTDYLPAEWQQQYGQQSQAPTPPPIPVVPGQTLRSPDGIEWFGGPDGWQQTQ